MVFTSLSFALFLPVVFTLYWYVFGKSAKEQNSLLLISSVVFYTMADWKFSFLLALLGLMNFLLAKFIASQEDESLIRRLTFYGGIILNVGILLYFKYFNFFIESFITLFNYNDGVDIQFTAFHIILPLGISFFTFQLIGYLIDVNNEEVEPTSDLLSFFTYLAYFPKILSGPIEKVQDFLPQIQKKREFNYELAVDGLRQILWGVFKKIVIANNLTIMANNIFDNYQEMPGSTLFFGSVFYIVSLYADFSGFSDMACGVSKLFNIKITNNFSFPFFATSISGFWKRWHISLTNWMMTYVYTPLSFMTRKYKKSGLILSIILTFLLVGLWHGANWTFVIFGVFHGVYFIPTILRGSLNKQPDANNTRSYFLSPLAYLKMFGVFILVSLTAIIFRSETIKDAYQYFKLLFSKTFFKLPNVGELMKNIEYPLVLIVLTLLFFVIEWFGRNQEFPIQNFGTKYKRTLRWGVYIIIISVVFMFIPSEESTFIYFQF